MTVNGTRGRKRQLQPRRVGSRAALASAIAVACLLAGGPTGAAGAAGATEHKVTVDPKEIYTKPGVAVHKGDTVTITATGTIHFGGGPIKALGPEGIPWGQECDRIANPRFRSIPWPLRGSACWSLIGRIGLLPPFEIGPGKTVVADHDGIFILGVNDNFVRDNDGSWDAKVTVTPPGVVPPSTSGGGSNSALVFVLLGAIVLIVLGLILFFVPRRRRKSVAAADAQLAPHFPPPPLVPGAGAEVAAVSLGVPEPEPEPEPMPVVPPIPTAPPDPESIDVNIFEVEFTNGLQLNVGYNHFPAGTLLNWKVNQSHKPVAAGSFITEGGGSTNHYETVALGIKLEGRDTHPDGADVQFDWNINGVPFRYSVRRDPNC
jgi:hypothetical protein